MFQKYEYFYVRHRKSIIVFKRQIDFGVALAEWDGDTTVWVERT